MDWFWSLEVLADIVLDFVKRNPDPVIAVVVAILVFLGGEIGARIKS